MDFGQRVPLNHPLPWVVAGLVLFSILFFFPSNAVESDPSHDRLVFQGKTDRPLQWVEMCLGKDWGGRLNLRHREANSASSARLDNPVRHYVVDVIDDGIVRHMRAYSRHGEAFSRREIEALEGCLTGRAFSLGDPRNR